MSLPKVISQETYDAVVLENILDFDKTLDEAIVDAVKEFEAQGVLLSNIIKEVALNEAGDAIIHPVLDALDVIKLTDPTSTSNDVTDCSNRLPVLEIFTEECRKSLPHRVMAASKGAYPRLVELVKDKQRASEEELVPLLQALQALTDGNPDLLDEDGVRLIQTMMEQYVTQRNGDAMEWLCRWSNSCTLKHENNREALFVAKVPHYLVKSLSGCSPTQHKSRILATLRAIRSYTVDDDIRAEFGKAHENCRHLVEEEAIIPVALELIDASVSENCGAVAGEALATLSAVCVRAEYCQAATDAGALATINSILTSFLDSPVLVKQAVSLLSTLAGDDKVKVAVMRAGSAPLLAAALDKHQIQAGVCTSCCSAVSMLALRHPQHAAQLLECGAAAGVLQAMKQHPKEKQLQKMGCLAIRNLCSRSPAAADALRALGAEQLVQTAIEEHGTAVADLAKSALRDLGADIKFEEQWRGQGHQLQQ